ncbi:hypothetical protein [Desertivibrio insolitus]|uniref:hypothetical protein n=1 Tax=Herbiconiux sp. SYSU D00978 TaxID=2812562 RepID=UPI001A95C31A|nr:hypothetical protein [Herbiconiux sp. SYSU D00978]
MRRLAALAVPALLLAGCSAPAAAPPAGVAVSVQQNRSDVAAGRLQIRVENTGPEELRLTRAVLTEERFDSPAVWEGDTTLAPGAARMLPAPLPDAACATDAGSPTVELTFSTPDAAGTVAVAAADPFDMVATVTGAECTAAEVAEAADLSLTGLHTDGGVAVLSLAIAPRADRELVVDSVARTILLQPEDGSAEWTVDASEGVVELRAVPARCDPHAVAEDKVGTRFRVTVALDGEPATVTVAASEELKHRIYEYLGNSCGW